jgi:cytochrome o ubiquinol oxidase subunit IV
MAEHHDTLEFGTRKKSYQSYAIGFVLSLLFTILAFGIVEIRFFPAQYIYISLAVLAIAQLLTQSICFLRLNASSEGRWNLLPFLFVILIIAILVAGTLWIMYNLNYNMR